MWYKRIIFDKTKEKKNLSCNNEKNDDIFLLIENPSKTNWQTKTFYNSTKTFFIFSNDNKKCFYYFTSLLYEEYLQPDIYFLWKHLYISSWTYLSGNGNPNLAFIWFMWSTRYLLLESIVVWKGKISQDNVLEKRKTFYGQMYEFCGQKLAERNMRSCYVPFDSKNCFNISTCNPQPINGFPVSHLSTYEFFWSFEERLVNF